MRLSGTVYSKVLEMDTGITVITPNELKMNQEYKVVYLLHGLCGNNRNWLDYSMLPVYAGNGDSIYIMPEVGRSFYTDMKYGFNYFTYITEELPAICKSIFHISAERENTVIMGGSMGGYGALKCALSRPKQYGMCGAFSSGCLFLKEGLTELREQGMRQEFTDSFGKQLLADFISMFGEAYEYKPECDIVSLLQKAGKETVKPKLYLTCGTQDYFYEDHMRFEKILENSNADYEFETWEAQHDFAYFNDALKKAIDKFSL